MSFLNIFKKKAPTTLQPLSIVASSGSVYAPASGRLESMESLPDPVFAGGAMGQAIGVWPEKGIVFAPISGTVSFAMPHAFGITNEELELLVHVGVDTVEMNGDGFTVKVDKGQQVEAGDILLVFDRERVAEAGYPDVIISIVTNSHDIIAAGGRIEPIEIARIEAGAPLLHVAH
jgi:glucose-specific phosphotransferase system IIA component